MCLTIVFTQSNSYMNLDGNQRNRELFLRELVSELSSALQSVVGMREAEGFVKIVGLKIGEAIYQDYSADAGDEKWSTQELADVLIDLKRKIDGGFSVESIDEHKVILVNDRCPFGDLVKGRPSLCQMTSSVFGKIAAEQFDYALVEIKEAIANGDDRCRVLVHLTPPGEGQAEGVEFYRS